MCGSVRSCSPQFYSWSFGDAPNGGCGGLTLKMRSRGALSTPLVSAQPPRRFTNQELYALCALVEFYVCTPFPQFTRFRYLVQPTYGSKVKIQGDHTSSNATAANAISFTKLAAVLHARMNARPCQVWDLSHPPPVLSQLPRVPTMEVRKEREGTISALNVVVESFNLAKEVSSIAPTKAVFGSVSVVLTMIRVGFILLFR